MDTQFQITRCPMCGCANLRAVYDDSADKKLTKGFFWGGLPGLAISAFRSRKATTTYWVCQKCGHTFVMDD